jgi:hypothetical protein
MYDSVIAPHFLHCLPFQHFPMEAANPGEDLFLYITDGAGRFSVEHPAPQGRSARRNGTPRSEVEGSLGQYDVILARPDSPTATITAPPGQSLHYLSFYLPTFLS